MSESRPCAAGHKQHTRARPIYQTGGQPIITEHKYTRTLCLLLRRTGIDHSTDQLHPAISNIIRPRNSIFVARARRFYYTLIALLLLSSSSSSCLFIGDCTKYNQVYTSFNKNGVMLDKSVKKSPFLYSIQCIFRRKITE